MEFSLPEFPSAPGAQAAFMGAGFCILLGLVFFAFPVFAGRFVGLESRQTRPGGIGSLRLCGGFLMGLSVATLLFDQPVLYTALGMALAVAAFARIVSLMSDRAATFLNFLLLCVQIVLAGATLYYLFDVFTPDTEYAVPEAGTARLIFQVYAALAVLGALVLLAPRIACSVCGIVGVLDTGYTSVRSGGGLLLGSALVGMAAANPMNDLGFGAALAFAAAGGLLALVIDRGNYIFTFVATAIAAGLSAVLLTYVFGLM